MTAYGTVETAVTAMKDGAYDFITKPLKRHALVKTVQKALEKQALLAENQDAQGAAARTWARRRTRWSDSRPRSARFLDTLKQAAPSHGDGAPPRRVRHRQGARRARAARALARGPRARSSRSTAAPSRDAARGRAVRRREGRLHRRGRAQGGALRARRRRHAVPRRGGRDAARGAGEAPARAAGGRDRAARRDPDRSRSTCASWPRPQGPRRARWPRAASARTSTTG